MNAPPLPAGPLRGELLNVERLEDQARALAARHTLARKTRRGASDFLSRLDDNARVLRVTYRALAEDVHRGEAVPPAAEWLLDNFHLIEAEVRGVRHDLPAKFYLELPKLAPRELAGSARVTPWPWSSSGTATPASTCRGSRASWPRTRRWRR
jgi:cyclic beta-1,2-glucan synthetase